MMSISVSAVPAQSLSVQLAGQACQINLFHKETTVIDFTALTSDRPNAPPTVVTGGLYVDLYLDNALLLAGVPALNANLIVRSAYLGFVGDLALYDTQGTSDPTYDGLGSRYLLVYIEQADLVAAGLA